MADIDKIEIGAAIKYEIQINNQKRCIGYIIQGFVNYTNNDEELVFELITPTGKTFKNTYYELWMWDDTFLGYPDNGAKYMPAYRDAEIPPDCDFVLVVDGKAVNTITGTPLTATAFPEPTYWPTLPGHEWVTPPWRSEGTCGTVNGVDIKWLSFYEAPYHIIPPIHPDGIYYDYKYPSTAKYSNNIYSYNWKVLVYTGSYEVRTVGAYSWCEMVDATDGTVTWALDYTGVNDQNTEDVNALLEYSFNWNMAKYNNQEDYHYYLTGFTNHDALPIYKEPSNEGFMTGSGIVISRNSVVFTDRKIGNGEAALFMVPSNTDRIYSYDPAFQADVSMYDGSSDTDIWNFGDASISTGSLSDGLPPGSGYVGDGCLKNSRYNATKTNTETTQMQGQFGIPIEVKYGTHTINCSGGEGYAMVYLLIEGEGFQKFRVELPDNSTIKIRVGEYTENIRGLIYQP